MEEKELEKLTATKLREIAKQYDEITGTHALKKEELIIAIRKARGEDVTSTEKGSDSKKIGTLKKKIKNLRSEKTAAQEKKDKKAATILRKRIKRYRRLTRKIAQSKAT